jgi:hypothetical protein
MLIIGCGFHTRYQQIAMLDEATGELTERQLDHQTEEAGGRVEDPWRVAPLFSLGKRPPLVFRAAGGWRTLAARRAIASKF